jgi:epoxide hydrolase 4
MIEGLRNPQQLLKSWYIFFFQLPRVAEAAFAFDDFRFPRRLLATDPADRDAFSEEDIERYVEAWSRPGTVRAMIDYYRAAVRDPNALTALLGLGDGGGELRTVRAPTLVIWGEPDTALSSELAEPDRRLVPGLVGVERIPGESHWVQNDAPERVNELLIGFLAGG